MVSCNDKGFAEKKTWNCGRGGAEPVRGKFVSSRRLRRLKKTHNVRGTRCVDLSDNCLSHIRRQPDNYRGRSWTIPGIPALPTAFMCRFICFTSAYFGRTSNFESRFYLKRPHTHSNVCIVPFGAFAGINQSRPVNTLCAAVSRRRPRISLHYTLAPIDTDIILIKKEAVAVNIRTS